MLSLIIAILFGLSITFFAFQNSILVPVTLGSFLFSGVPLYIVVVVSVLTGIFMAWFISAFEGVSYWMRIRQRDGVINNDKREIVSLQKQIQGLKTENVHLREKKENVTDNRIITDNRVDYEREINYEHKPSIWERLFPTSTRHYSKQV